MPSLDLSSEKTDSDRDVKGNPVLSSLSPNTQDMVAKVAKTVAQNAIIELLKDGVLNQGRPVEFPHVADKARVFYSSINIKMLLLALVKTHSWKMRRRRRRKPGV